MVHCALLRHGVVFRWCNVRFWLAPCVCVCCFGPGVLGRVSGTRFTQRRICKNIFLTPMHCHHILHGAIPPDINTVAPITSHTAVCGPLLWLMARAGLCCVVLCRPPSTESMVSSVLSVGKRSLSRVLSLRAADKDV